MAQPAHTLEPEQYGNEHSPRPTQRGIPTFSTHAGRARRIQRAYELEDRAPGTKRPSLLAILTVDAALCAHARSKGRAWPYVATLAAETHQGERTVRYATQWLEAQGFLVKRQTGRYSIFFPTFLTVAGAEQNGTRCLSKEGGVCSAPSEPHEQTPTSTAATLENHERPDPEQPTPSGGGVADLPSATGQAEPPAPAEASHRTATAALTQALCRAAGLTMGGGLAAAIRHGVAVRLERGVCVLAPRTRWQAELLAPLLRPSEDARYIELLQAVELATGATRLRIVAPPR